MTATGYRPPLRFRRQPEPDPAPPRSFDAELLYPGGPGGGPPVGQPDPIRYILWLPSHRPGGRDEQVPRPALHVGHTGGVS